MFKSNLLKNTNENSRNEKELQTDVFAIVWGDGEDSVFFLSSSDAMTAYSLNCELDFGNLKQ